MQLSRTSSEVNLYSPFLLKFEGRMTQISKKGTLTVPPPVFASSFQHNTQKLTEKRAFNILLDLGEIRSKNAREIEHISHRHDDSPTSPSNHPFATVLEHRPAPAALCPSVINSGGFSEDFRRMLQELDNISVGRKNK